MSLRSDCHTMSLCSDCHTMSLCSDCHTMSPFVQVLSQKDDFLAVGLRNGHLKVVVSLGGWTQTDLVTKHSVNDGLWHSVTLQRRVHVQREKDHFVFFNCRTIFLFENANAVIYILRIN